MKDLEQSLKAVEQAIRRKTEIKRLMEVLYEEYKLVKAEIQLHQERIEKSLSAKEYSAFLDTIRMDTSLEFPSLSDQKRSDDKK